MSDMPRVTRCFHSAEFAPYIKVDDNSITITDPTIVAFAKEFDDADRVKSSMVDILRTWCIRSQAAVNAEIDRRLNALPEMNQLFKQLAADPEESMRFLEAKKSPEGRAAFTEFLTRAVEADRLRKANASSAAEPNHDSA